MPKTTPDVVIFKAGGKFHVHPGTVRVKVEAGKAEVSFRNDTDRKVGVWLPVADPVVSALWFEASEQKPLTVNGAVRGVYDYAVYVDKENQFAEGNSAPRMIFDEN